MRIVGGLMVVALMAATSCSDNGEQRSDASASDEVAASSSSSVASTVGSTVEEPEAVATVPRSTTTLPDCEVDDAIVAPSRWPHSIPEALIVRQADVDGSEFRLEGLTADAESLVVAAMDSMFPGFEPAEPTGGASDVQIKLESEAGDAMVSLVERDLDGCWDVVVEAVYIDAPVFEPDDPDEDEADGDDGDDGDDGGSGSVPEVSDDDATSDDPPVADLEFDEATAVGRAEVVTARGSFTLFVMQCGVDPVAVDAAGPGGGLAINGPVDAPVVRWTYPDGIVIEDDEPHVLTLGADGGALFAEGEGPDGPESLVVDYVCE